MASIYENLSQKSLQQEDLDRETCRQILEDSSLETFSLLHSAFAVRKHFRGRKVTVHIINNSQNGFCPEDCHYCAQAKTSKADIESYPLKSEDEIMAEAKNAYEKGAHRYCMVFAGRGPSQRRVENLAGIIKKIKNKYPLEICVSAGLLDYNKATVLKAAGLDRLNHNLNTSEKHYPKICTTHTYEDRLNTLSAARQAGIQLCSGMIAGMGETSDDIIDTALTLREKKVESIPVNFLIPISGNAIEPSQNLSPDYCLRILCLFRFLNPVAEIRMAAGRELHLRSLQVMGLYAADSLFLDGYLNTKGGERRKTLQMIQDAGFEVASDKSLDDLIKNEDDSISENTTSEPIDRRLMKSLQELRPEQPLNS